MDEYVKPSLPISNYRTWMSGIQPGYEHNAKPKDEVVVRLKNIIKGHVLVGHDIEKDLNVLGITHTNVKDLATYVPFLKCGQKQSLKNLAYEKLGMSIQNGAHNSLLKMHER